MIRTRHAWLAASLLAGAAGCGSDDPDDSLGRTVGQTAVAFPGITITDVSMTQSVRKPLVEAGAAVDVGVPIVGGREALVRVYYELANADAGDEVEVELVIGDAEPLTSSHTLTDEMSVSDLESTMNVAVPASVLSAGQQPWQLTVRVGDEPIARYPEGGEAVLDVATNAISLELVLVPIDYRPTNTVAVADASVAQPLVDAVYARFPVSEVALSVTEALVYDDVIRRSSADDWRALRDAVLAKRAADGAAPHQFYVGLFDPGVDPVEWCRKRCTFGYSPDERDRSPHASQRRCRAGCIFGSSPEASLSYDPGTHGLVAAVFPSTFTINVLSGMGEAFDRPRVSCEHADAWGYDLLEKRLVDPEGVRDIMTSRTCLSPSVWPAEDTYTHLVNQLMLVGADG